MGQKVNPLSLRLGITEDWRSRWYAGKQTFGTMLVEDQKVRKMVQDKYRFAGIPRVDIERTREEVRVIMFTMRPGIIIGRKGAEVEDLRAQLESLTGRKVNITIREILKPELNAALVAESVGDQLMRRASFKRAIRRAAEATMEAGAMGVRIKLSGRLAGAEMARTEQTSMGSIPLSTLRAKIDYGVHQAITTYGAIGVKVWVYLGEVGEDGLSEVEAKLAAQSAGRPGVAGGRPRPMRGGRGGPGGGGQGGAGGGRRGGRRRMGGRPATTRSGRLTTEETAEGDAETPAREQTTEKPEPPAEGSGSGPATGAPKP
jgi:small subunit ribosomal protein S3